MKKCIYCNGVGESEDNLCYYCVGTGVREEMLYAYIEKPVLDRDDSEEVIIPVVTMQVWGNEE